MNELETNKELVDIQKSNIAIYQSADGKIRINTKIEDESIWLTQQMMVDLFQSSKKNISDHIINIFKEEELEEDSVVRNFRTTAADGKNYNVKYYNLDMIISVGYRVKSKVATQFRKWATRTLREYLVSGYVINEQRLKKKEKQLQTLKSAIDLIERGISNQINDFSQTKAINWIFARVFISI